MKTVYINVLSRLSTELSTKTCKFPFGVCNYFSVLATNVRHCKAMLELIR